MVGAGKVITEEKKTEARLMSSESAGTSRRSLRRSIRQLGESLGTTPGDVAASLVALEVRGSPRNSSECAMARYLRAVIGTETCVSDVSVSDRRVHVTRTQRQPPIMVRLPRPVIKFIRAFDLGGYPELVDSSPRPGADLGQQPASPRPDPGH
jgi:hypothetical protein